MRMWMVNPRIMCRKHLMGEHVETHMFVGSINRGNDIWGYVKNNLVEPNSLTERHDELSQEMIRRGYNHKSPIKEVDLSRLIEKEKLAKVDSMKSLVDLLSRCKYCATRYQHIQEGTKFEGTCDDKLL